MRVSYDKDHRSDAKKEGKRLYTFQLTHPGGRGGVTVQGFFDDKTMAEIAQMAERITRKK